jgi:hypothetical protein
MTGAWLAIGVAVSASANVITDRDEKAVAVVMPPRSVGVSQQVYTAPRTMGMVDAAMVDAVNSIARRYQPYLVQLPTDPATSKTPRLLQLLRQCWRQLMRKQRMQ